MSLKPNTAVQYFKIDWPRWISLINTRTLFTEGVGVVWLTTSLSPVVSAFFSLTGAFQLEIRIVCQLFESEKEVVLLITWVCEFMLLLPSKLLGILSIKYHCNIYH